MTATHVHSQTRHGSGCAVCSNQRVEVGFNDLSTTGLDLVPQYDWETDRASVEAHILTQIAALEVR